MGQRPGQKRKYIRNCAKTAMQRHEIDPRNFYELNFISEIAAKLQEDYGSAIYLDVGKLKGETCGKLAECGAPDDAGRFSTGMGVSLWDINGREEWLNGRWPGANLLHTIASSVILAEVCNLIIAQHPRTWQLKHRG